MNKKKLYLGLIKARLDGRLLVYFKRDRERERRLRKKLKWTETRDKQDKRLCVSNFA